MLSVALDVALHHIVEWHLDDGRHLLQATDNHLVFYFDIRGLAVRIVDRCVVADLPILEQLLRVGLETLRIDDGAIGQTMLQIKHIFTSGLRRECQGQKC